jgi:ribonuclease-3
MNNPKNLLELRDNSYERLEYFGDRVIKLIVSMYLFYRYPDQDEGFMTRLHTKIEDKTNLAIMSKEIGLDKFFIISKQIESMNGRNLEIMNVTKSLKHLTD